MKVMTLIGTAIAMSSLVPAMALAEVEDADSGLFKRDYQLILGLGLSTGTESDHDEAFLVSEGKPQAAKGSLSWEDGFIINLEIANSPAHGWGHSIGVLYNPEHSVQSGFLTNSQTGEVAELPRGLKTSELLFYSNLLYRFEIFYASAGINFSRMKWESDNPDLRVVRSSGGIAGQAAVGWKLSRKLAVEYQFVMTSFDLELAAKDSSSPERYRIGNSQLSTNHFVMKYTFN
jgi:hypothetical protein